MLPFLLAVAAPTAPVPLTPLGSLITAADYPAGAKQRGASGLVGFRLQVDATGRPDACVVWQTSGAADLDNATCDLMLARARFAPAHAPHGEPMRGDYAGRIAWTLQDRPEPFISEFVTIRELVDASGRVTSCTVTPAEAATERGGCDNFSDPRTAEQLIGRSLTGIAWFEVRMIKQDPAQPTIDPPVPSGAEKRVMARSTMTIAPTGAVASCKDDLVARFDDRPLALCAVGFTDPQSAFAPSTSPEPRLLVVSLETVTQKR